jgi:hypothetical protein
MVAMRDLRWLFTRWSSTAGRMRRANAARWRVADVAFGERSNDHFEDGIGSRSPGGAAAPAQCLSPAPLRDRPPTATLHLSGTPSVPHRARTEGRVTGNDAGGSVRRSSAPRRPV